MYRIETTARFDKELRKLDKASAKYILRYIRKNIMPLDDPRLRGKALTGDKKGYWRYRIGEFRLICEIRDDELLILAISIGYRKEAYNRF